MLLSFAIENFRSFETEQTINLLASKRLGPNCGSPHLCKVPGINEHVLRVASLYGANGAGKSNVVRALSLLKRLVLDGTPPGKHLPYQPFLLDNAAPTKPTCFEVQFIEEEEVYRYGMAYDAERIHEEWLSVYEGKKERNVFIRTRAEKGGALVELAEAAGKTNGSEKITALAKVGARPNQLFLTEVVNLDDRAAQGPRFRNAVNWFKSSLGIIEADARFDSLPAFIATQKRFADFAGRLLREASTGIAGLNMTTLEIPRSKLTPEEIEDFEGRGGGKAGLPLADISPMTVDEATSVDTSGKDAIKFHTVLAMHDVMKGERIPFPLYEESDGSQRFLNLLPALYHLMEEHGVFVIDELERSMHPMLARKFVEFFLKAARHTKSQLIFTTHESTLLDLELLRRDGIWFTEKDEKGATHLYSLADFKVRKDLRIEKGYLEGRFGAIPFLGGMDQLMEEETAAEEKA